MTAAGRKIFTCSGSAVSIPDGNQPSILNTSYTMTADIDVPVLNDSLVEPTETVVLTLTGFGSHDPDIGGDAMDQEPEACRRSVPDGLARRAD